MLFRSTAIGNPARIIEAPLTTGAEVGLQKGSPTSHSDPLRTSTASEESPTGSSSSAPVEPQLRGAPEERKSDFSAYGITQADDPVAQSIKELQDRALEQEKAIEALKNELSSLSLKVKGQ